MQKSSVNKVILVGHIGNKPEGRYTPNGVSTATFSLATNESWLGADNEKQERTEWHNIVAWNKLADFATEYLQKGQLVYIEGRIQSRVYKDKENINRRISEIVSTSITPLEWKNLNDEKKEDMSSDDVKNIKKDEEDDQSIDDLPF